MMTYGEDEKIRRWKAIGSGVIGASHVRGGKPCQDALLISYSENASYCIISLADGHGSNRCPYSGEGAQVAVSMSNEFFLGLLAGEGVTRGYSLLNANKEIWLPKQLEAEWKERIRTLHMEKERPLPQDGQFPYELYGTTLISLVAAEDFIFAIQIGDGDILLATVETRLFLPSDNGTPDAVGNETYSLCMEPCWPHFCTCIVPLTYDFYGDDPMFLLATDGYANSFASHEGFLQAGSDIRQILNKQGLDYVSEQLEGWLTHASTEGSGDDITMAIVTAQ